MRVGQAGKRMSPLISRSATLPGSPELDAARVALKLNRRLRQLNEVCYRCTELFAGMTAA